MKTNDLSGNASQQALERSLQEKGKLLRKYVNPSNTSPSREEVFRDTRRYGLEKLRLEFERETRRSKHHLTLLLVALLFGLVFFFINARSDPRVLTGAQCVMIFGLIVFWMLGRLMFSSRRKSSLKAEIETKKIQLGAIVEEDGV
jgi:Flp pilus assembly protein TadB